MNDIIGARHEFHDEQFVAGWADRFAPTPERIRLFNVILAELESRTTADACVVELGLGPGYLADHLLGLMPGIRYVGVDFSRPMIGIARRRLARHADRVTFVHADLVEDRWWSGIATPVGAIVSTWALHDLGSQEAVETVYRQCAAVLRSGGVMLNGDFIKPEQTTHEYEPGRFEVARHIDMLQRAGFGDVGCLVVLEEEIDSPTSAQNYACLRGVI